MYMWKKMDNLDMILDQLYEYDMVLLARFEDSIIDELDIKDLLSEYVLVYNDGFELWDVDIKKKYLYSREQRFLKYLKETRDTGCYISDFLKILYYRDTEEAEKNIKKWFKRKI